MATSVLSNALLLFDGQNLTGQSNVVAINYGVEPKDDTTLDDDTRSSIGGLKTAGISAEGFFDGPMDSALFTAVGASGSLISIANGLSVGDIAYSLQSMAGEYQPMGGSVGDMLAYSLNASARGDLKRGELLFHSTSEASSSNGSGSNAGAAATQVTAFLHVFTATGTTPTLDVTIESDVDNTFSTPATQITFAQATAVGAERVVSVGAVTDTWWRVAYTISGTTPVFGFAVTLIVE